MITDFQKTKIFINEGYEKLLINYKDIESFLLNLSLSIPSDYKGQILKIKDDLLSMKDNFKLFISSLNEYLHLQLHMIQVLITQIYQNLLQLLLE